MAYRKKRVRGAASVRRVMKNLPDAVRDEMIEVLESGSIELQRLIAGATPRRTGKLREGIKRRVLKQSLRMQVGLLGTKKGRARLFYGRILDLGRKAQTVNVTRRKNTAPYLMRVRGIAAKRFVTGRYPDVRAIIGRRLRGIWERALPKAAGGASDD